MALVATSTCLEMYHPLGECVLKTAEPPGEPQESKIGVAKALRFG